jgi:hypothetical protein
LAVLPRMLPRRLGMRATRGYRVFAGGRGRPLGDEAATGVFVESGPTAWGCGCYRRFCGWAGQPLGGAAVTGVFVESGPAAQDAAATGIFAAVFLDTGAFPL